MAFDWKKTLATVAPMIATALGGPLAGVAVKVVADKLGIEANEDALATAVGSGDTNIFLQLKEAENSFKLEMKRLDITLKELETQAQGIAAGDRMDARQFSVKTSLVPQLVLSSIFITGFVIITYAIFTGAVALTQDQKDIAMYLLGIMSAAIVQIMNYFFGSTAGSKRKTDLMALK